MRTAVPPRRPRLAVATCLLLALLAVITAAEARRRPHALVAGDPPAVDPTVSVRLGIAPPWRITVGANARLNGEPLPPGTYEVAWTGAAVRLQGGDVRREAAGGLQLSSDPPVTINGRGYRGTFLFRRWSVLNQLSMQDYLRGVVGCEIGAKAELEAMKAQAVVARTYTLGHLTAEIADDTSFQVYKGMEVENDDVNLAVDETAGQVVTWQGKVAREVCYHSTCGGATEGNENVFLTTPIPYLRSVPCVITPPATSAPKPGPTPHRADEQSMRTHVVAMAPLDGSGVLASGELPQPLEVDTIEPQDSTPAVAPPPTRPTSSAPQNACQRSSWFHWKICWPAASLPEIVVLKTSASGRVVRVQVGGRTYGGDDIRRALRFRDVMGRVRSLYSTMFTLRREGAYVVAEGSGWGHGVGLCQWGARGMAHAGATYVEILRHYFPGTEVSGPTEPAENREARP